MEFDLTEPRATDAQVNYILMLLAKLQEEGEHVPLDDSEVDLLTKAEASTVIDDLKQLLGWS